jgi:hypothetical protein
MYQTNCLTVGFVSDVYPGSDNITQVSTQGINGCLNFIQNKVSLGSRIIFPDMKRPQRISRQSAGFIPALKARKNWS